MPLDRSLDMLQDVEAAIARVLEAERLARLAVAQAQARAAENTESARAAVRALDARTERRVRGIRAAFASAVERAVADLDAQTIEPDAPAQLSASDLKAVAAAVSALSAALTSGRA